MKKIIFFSILTLLVVGFTFIIFRFVQKNEGEYGVKNLPDIIVESPKENSRIQSPVMIRGKARGTWFFEASFPILLQDKERNTIIAGPARAEGEWMTDQYVPFSAEFIFSGTKNGEKGFLVFKKDNPSGLPEHDASTSISITF